jgi:hypothetical protein
MAIDTGATTATTPRPPVDDWGRRDRVLGGLLLGVWVAVIATTVLTGSRPSTYAHLQDLVAAGDVTRVEVVGEPLPFDPAGGSARVTREVRWREGLWRRTALVDETDREGATGRTGTVERRAVLTTTVEEDLSGLGPDVSFAPGEHRSTSLTVLGAEVGGWVTWAYPALLLATLWVNGAGRPWRATRWAWAWLVLLVQPWGIAAFLLLGGPTGLFRPRDTGRVWLTGGWAFLLALLLGGASASS